MNVMLLDEDAELSRLLEGVLESDGMWVVQYTDPAEAVAAAVNGEWVAVLVNVDLADGAAEAFLEVLGDLDGVSIPVVLTSARHREFDEEVQGVMTRFGHTLFLRKPIPLLDLNDMLRQAREGHEMDAFPNAGTSPSISVELQLSDVNEIAFSRTGDSATAATAATATQVDADPSSRRKRAMQGVLGAVQRGRDGVEELIELTDDDLVPISVLPDELQALDSASESFEMEIDDDDDDEESVHHVVLR